MRYGSPGSGTTGSSSCPQWVPSNNPFLSRGIEQVKIDVQVEVVTSDRSVDEVLGEREHERRRDRRAELRSDVGERFDGRLQVLQILDQVVLSVVDQPGGRVAEHAKVIQGAVRRGRSLISTSRAGGILCSASVMTSRWSAKVPTSRFSAWMEATMLSRLVVQRSHERVEASDQITEGALVPRQGGREIVDDLPDLPQSPAVDDRAQRRQRLLGRRVGRGRGSAGWWHPAAAVRFPTDPSGVLSSTCIEPSRLV